MQRILFALVGLLLLPGVAAATHFVEPSLLANCAGYETDFTVEFHPAVYEINFAVLVTITDPEGAELFRYEGADVLVRENEDVFQSYHFEVLWNDVTDEIIPLFGLMDIMAELRIFYPVDSPFYSTNTEGKLAVFDSQLECSAVPNDDLSWSSLKTSFR